MHRPPNQTRHRSSRLTTGRPTRFALVDGSAVAPLKPAVLRLFSGRVAGWAVDMLHDLLCENQRYGRLGFLTAVADPTDEPA